MISPWPPFDSARPLSVRLSRPEASATRTEVRLSWTHGLAGIESFRVETQRQKGRFDAVATVPGSASGTVLGGLRPNRALTLRVVALRGDGMVAGATKPIRIRTRK